MTTYTEKYSSPGTSHTEKFSIYDQLWDEITDLFDSGPVVWDLWGVDAGTPYTPKYT